MKRRVPQGNERPAAQEKLNPGRTLDGLKHVTIAAARTRARQTLASMSVYYPKSFFKLVVSGFFLVALPLVLAIANNASYIERSTEHAERSVYGAVTAIQASYALQQQLQSLETGSSAFPSNSHKPYGERRQALHRTIDRLRPWLREPAQQQRLALLASKEQQLSAALPSAGPSQLKAAFAELHELAGAIVAGNQTLVERSMRETDAMATRARRILLWQSLVLLPIAGVLAAAFIVLLARPVRQIDEAIRTLGSGELSRPISVRGPEDLRQLGERLDWLRRQLIELEEQKTKFLRHVSHELKTPLTTIREGSELLADQIVGSLNSQQQEVTKILRQNSVQLQRLIEDLLNFNVAQLRNAVLDITPVRLDAIIKEVVNSHKLAVLSKNLKLFETMARLTLQGDAEKLRVVIDNLVSNAVKYSPHGGTLRMSLHREGSTAIFDIIDNGPGIDSRDRDKIFDPFFQGRIAHEGHVKGTGLGLSIAREYVIAHGGKLELVTDVLKGAHFRMTLPVELAGHPS